MNENPTTQELWMKLINSPSIETFLTEADTQLPRFSEYITQLCKDRNEKPEQILKRADIESSFGHRIFTGARNPSRDTVLQMAFGFAMDPQKTQQLLKVARQAALHPKIRRDAVIAWCLQHHRSLIETQQILHDKALPLIGGMKHV